MISWLTSPPPIWSAALQNVRNRHLALADLILLPLAAALAFGLRLDREGLLFYAVPMTAYILAAPLIKMPIFRMLGVYTRYWQFASIDEAGLLALSALLGALVQGALFLGILGPLHRPGDIPRSIPLIDIFVTFVFIAGPRFALRLGAQSAHRRVHDRSRHGKVRRVLIVGAGNAGLLVLRELYNNPQTGIVPVGLIDDDPAKQGISIGRCRVLGDRALILELTQTYEIDEAIIAMPSAPGQTIRELVAICEQAGLAVRIVPAVYELLAGQISLHQIRDVRIEDLLRREPVWTDTAQVTTLLRGRRVLVTGAGGSIGTELCRQILYCQPAELLLLGHGENSLVLAEAELGRLAACVGLHDFATPRFTTLVADIRDRDRLECIFARHQPEIVFHAAAHKHVPVMEFNIEDAVTNNVLGTQQVLEASAAAGVTHFVLISTDKAVNPTSIMGATERAAELLVQATAQATGRAYVAVRFGNVLGSRGSVVPFFQQQIADGGPVTVTHPDMRRYFMTIPEAVQLVLQAAAIGHGGEVFALDMGQPVRIVDLALDLIRLSGLEPDRDIKITFTGLRPGEKLFEELFMQSEHYAHTRHDKIFVYTNGKAPAGADADLHTAVAALVMAARCGQAEKAQDILRRIVPEYQPNPNPGARGAA